MQKLRMMADDQSLLEKVALAVRQAPDVREDLIASVRQELADGTYKTAPKLIAMRLLRVSSSTSR